VVMAARLSSPAIAIYASSGKHQTSRACQLTLKHELQQRAADVDGLLHPSLAAVSPAVGSRLLSDTCGREAIRLHAPATTNAGLDPRRFDAPPHRHEQGPRHSDPQALPRNVAKGVRQVPELTITFVGGCRKIGRADPDVGGGALHRLGS
jgi:hypothetical protein